MIKSSPVPSTRETGLHIKETRDLVQYFGKWKDERQECFLVLSLTVKMEVISVEEVSRGTLSEVLVHPREVFFPAIKNNAYAIVVAHNHPSGDVTPSPADQKVVKAMVKAGKIMMVEVVDSIVFNSKLNYYSFVENDSPLF